MLLNFDCLFALMDWMIKTGDTGDALRVGLSHKFLLAHIKARFGRQLSLIGHIHRFKAASAQVHLPDTKGDSRMRMKKRTDALRDLKKFLRATYGFNRKTDAHVDADCLFQLKRWLPAVTGRASSLQKLSLFAEDWKFVGSWSLDAPFLLAVHGFNETARFKALFWDTGCVERLSLIPCINYRSWGSSGPSFYAKFDGGIARRRLSKPSWRYIWLRRFEMRGNASGIYVDGIHVLPFILATNVATNDLTLAN